MTDQIESSGASPDRPVVSTDSKHSTSMLPRVRTLVREIEQRSADRVERLERIEQGFDRDGQTSESSEQERREAIEQTRLNIVISAQERHTQHMEKLKTDLKSRLERVRERREEAIESLHEKAERNSGEARRQLQETKWLAETVYEASEDKPADAERVALEGIEGRRRQMTEARELAEARLRRNRMPLPTFSAPIDPDDASQDVDPPTGRDEAQLEAADASLEAAADRSTEIADAIARAKAPRLFAGLMLPAILFIGVGAGAGIGFGLASAGVLSSTTAAGAGIGAGVTLAFGGLLAIGLNLTSRRAAHRAGEELAHAWTNGENAASSLRRAAMAKRVREEFELVETRDKEIRRADERFSPIISEVDTRLARKLKQLEEKADAEHTRITEAIETMMTEQTELHEERIERAHREAEDAERELTAEFAGSESERTARRSIARTRLRDEWNEAITAADHERSQLESVDRVLFPDWSHPSWANWEPPTSFAPAARFARVRIDRSAVPGSRPDHPDFADPLPETIELPLTLDFPEHCSLLVRSSPATRADGLNVITGTMMRLLAAVPPGKLQFTILDPVGLGESFAGFMHLGDHDESFIGGRIWTEPRHIEQRLADLTEHMEHVIQKYLRNEYDSIASYNEAAGEVAEPYRFLVIADFPAGMADESVKRLQSIIASGPRCGVFTLILADARKSIPSGLDLSDLKGSAVVIEERDGELVLDDEVLGRWPLVLDSAPDDELQNALLNRIGSAALDGSRVEVPFSVIAPGEGERWSRTSERELRVPLGKSGATRHQAFVLGPGTSQHALIAGKTGSGKSTLLHVLITNLAMWYSPDEVRFYLVDFKKGVEFKTYAAMNLPHAMAVAVESDREFGLSVLERIDEELRERGEAFRDAGVQDVAGFRLERPDTPMPRIMLVVDEFQEMFVEDDRIGQEAALLMDRIVRQGRAFGIHVVLGSQTLGGSYSLPRSTLGQMQVRIALQCSESDAYLIMSDDNSAARLLTRPGEAIYNDAGGRIEGNSPFQIVWLPEKVREQHLGELHTAATEGNFDRGAPLVVFEGNVPAEPADNRQLEAVLDAGQSSADAPPRSGPPAAWLGEAIAIKDPTAAVFGRRSGANLLIVGQRDEAATSMMALSGLALAAQTTALADGQPNLIVLDGTPPDTTLSGFLASSLADLPIHAEFPAYREVDAAIARVAELVRDRAGRDASNEPPVFLMIHGLQRFRSLRPGDEFGFSSSFDEEKPPAPDKQFAEILEDGPLVGVHVLAWCDTATNLQRALPRAGLREFDMRVAFQMSAADSTQFIDSPEASNLGLQRSLFFSEEAGRLEKFRPYRRPDASWIESTRARITAE
ncbi:MAG: FtsK/SpoIIIE domain-containing protein [Phycisphaerales bacterium]